MRVVLDAAAVHKALTAMAEGLLARKSDAPLALVGIRRGGEPLAQRLARLIAKKVRHEPPIGKVDITLYRDDGFGPHDWPVVGVTEIPFDLTAHTVVLVDDVLYSGRTVRAAIDAILDYGRPRAVRLAVLVDRGLRELPIGADVVGLSLSTKPNEHVDVQLVETGAQADQVVVRAREESARA
ncbi:MAG: bifunctional pyr operon transcriptional regulator/uracil phosphoribosyltransferase PyrR [Deltaproteobacteria bacterium]|nr:bifunctional pyr operon transcriptional regulator/uracil phosphoribosyltransferase PyrR [Deltaproteobacteria bacterium]